MCEFLAVVFGIVTIVTFGACRFRNAHAMHANCAAPVPARPADVLDVWTTRTW